MPRLRVKDKQGLGHFVLSAALNNELKGKLEADPAAMLGPFIEELPPNHKIRIVVEDDNTTTLVLPPAESIPRSSEEIEQILREEASQYDSARRRVDESKGRSDADVKKRIPPEVLRETFALMIGNTALSPTSRPRPREVPDERSPALTR